MKHQVLADQAAGIGDTVGEFRRYRVQHQARRADAVAGEDDDFGGLKLLLALGIIIDHAGGHAVCVDRDLANPAHRAQLDAGADRMRPIGDVGAGLGALRAARQAVAEVDAARPPLVVRRGDRRVRRPPVPAELVHRLAEPRAGFAERQWRHRRLMRRIGRIAGKPRDAHHAVVLGEVRRQRGVVERPVVGDAIERAHAKIGGVKAREVRGVQNGAAADGVELRHLDRRVGVVDRIVVGRARRLGLKAKSLSWRAPSPGRRWDIGRLHPVALLEAEDVHPRIGQTPGHRRARCPGTDDQDIDFIKHRFFLPANPLIASSLSAVSMRDSMGDAIVGSGQKR